jgi:hypothetical protein
VRPQALVQLGQYDSPAPAVHTVAVQRRSTGSNSSSFGGKSVTSSPAVPVVMKQPVTKRVRRVWAFEEMNCLMKGLQEHGGNLDSVYAAHGPEGDGTLGRWTLKELFNKVKSEHQQRKLRGADLGPFVL